jgi:hypothetical protein
MRICSGFYPPGLLYGDLESSAIIAFVQESLNQADLIFAIAWGLSFSELGGMPADS